MEPSGSLLPNSCIHSWVQGVPSAAAASLDEYEFFTQCHSGYLTLKSWTCSSNVASGGISSKPCLPYPSSGGTITDLCIKS